MIKVKRIFMNQDQSNSDVIAFFDIEVSGFCIKGFRLRKDNPYYVSYPAKQGKDKKWYAIAFPTDPQVKTELKNAIENALNDIKEKRISITSEKNMNTGDGVGSQKELSESEKIEISKQYLPLEFISRAGSRAMRSGIYGDMKQRMRE